MIDIVAKIGPASVKATFSPSPATAQTGMGTGSFSNVFDSVVKDTVNTLVKGETAAISGISGKATIQQVVDQVMEAERALQTTLAVRDKVVSAYQEISRMAI